MGLPDDYRVTLSKACDQCIQAKRKCSRNLPKCLRCAKRRIPCRYKNSPLDGSVIHQAAKFTAATRKAGPIRKSEKFDNPLNSPFFRGIAKTIENTYSLDPTAPRFISLGMKEPEIILAMDETSVKYLADHFKSFPSVFIQTGGGPFIHPKLYQEGLPPPLRNIISLCHVYAHLDGSNKSFPLAISHAAEALLESRPNLYTFKLKLAFVQALILLQIITLFSPMALMTPLLYQQAENRVALLKASVRELYRSMPETLPPAMPPYEAWVLGESCRRTMHIGHLVHGVYLMLTKGTFNLTMFVKALPLCRNVGLWELDPSAQDEWGIKDGNKFGNAKVLDSELISYRELTDLWDNDEVEKLHLFEEMLIAACKGIHSVQDRFLGFHSPPQHGERG